MFVCEVYNGYLVLQKQSSDIAVRGASSSSCFEVLPFPLKVVPFTSAETPFCGLIAFIPFLATVYLVEEVLVDGVAEVGGG